MPISTGQLAWGVAKLPVKGLASVSRRFLGLNNRALGREAKRVTNKGFDLAPAELKPHVEAYRAALKSNEDRSASLAADVLRSRSGVGVRTDLSAATIARRTEARQRRLAERLHTSQEAYEDAVRMHYDARKLNNTKWNNRLRLGLVGAGAYGAYKGIGAADEAVGPYTTLD